MNDNKVTANFVFKPKEPFTVFALQLGGILPLCFTQASILLVDRNIVSIAENVINGGKNPRNKANTWWYKFVDDERFLINPAVAALEGAKPSITSYEDFCDEFRRCCAILKATFPRAKVVDYTPAAYKGAYALLQELTRSYDSEISFLMKVAPTIVEYKAASKLQDHESQILQDALESGLKLPTLSLLAALSCLYGDSSMNEASPGRRVLKPKRNYTKQMAHNSIMDLYALSLLIQGNAKLPANSAFVTSDKGLIRFWCALRVSHCGAETGDGLKVSFEFSGDMFQRLDENGRVALKRRIETTNQRGQSH